MIGPAGFMAAPRPAYGTALIRCGERKCGWVGYETQLVGKPHPKINRAEQLVCPLCGCDSYWHMTEREIAAWKKAQPTATEKENHG